MATEYDTIDVRETSGTTGSNFDGEYRMILHGLETSGFDGDEICANSSATQRWRVHGYYTDTPEDDHCWVQPGYQYLNIDCKDPTPNNMEDYFPTDNTNADTTWDDEYTVSDVINDAANAIDPTGVTNMLPTAPDGIEFWANYNDADDVRWRYSLSEHPIGPGYIDSNDYLQDNPGAELYWTTTQNSGTFVDFHARAKNTFYYDYCSNNVTYTASTGWTGKDTWCYVKSEC